MRHFTRARAYLTRAFPVIGGLSLALACADPAPTGPSATSPSRASGVVAVAAPSATAIGNIIGYAVNDAGIIVGPSDGNKSGAYMWSAATGLKLLGAGGLAWDLSQDGLATRVLPSTLIAYDTTRWKRLRGDATYAYRQAKQAARHAWRQARDRARGA